jgi:hypothetical protein
MTIIQPLHVAPLPAQQVGTTSHRTVATSALVVALSALGGAIGLATGSLPLTPELERGLPWHSPVFAAAALAAVVGVPFLVVHRFARTDDPRLRSVAAGAGALLVAWIAVEYLVVRAFSPFQVAYLLVGIAFVWFGLYRPRAGERG